MVILIDCRLSLPSPLHSATRSRNKGHISWQSCSTCHWPTMTRLHDSLVNIGTAKSPGSKDLVVRGLLYSLRGIMLEAKP